MGTKRMSTLVLHKGHTEYADVFSLALTGAVLEQGNEEHVPPLRYTMDTEYADAQPLAPTVVPSTIRACSPCAAPWTQSMLMSQLALQQ
jgi:hypothetical protein